MGSMNVIFAFFNNVNVVYAFSNNVNVILAFPDVIIFCCFYIISCSCSVFVYCLFTLFRDISKICDNKKPVLLSFLSHLRNSLNKKKG